MHALELKVPPVAQVLVSATLMWALAVLVPSADMALSSGPLIAIVLALAGAAIGVLGVLELRAAETTIDPRVPHRSASLVVRGVYRFSRNPMYVGLFLMLCAWGAFLGNVLALVMLPVFVAYMNRFQIEPEERHMSEKFGQAYRQYADSVRRWV